MDNSEKEKLAPEEKKTAYEFICRTLDELYPEMSQEEFYYDLFPPDAVLSHEEDERTDNWTGKKPLIRAIALDENKKTYLSTSVFNDLEDLKDLCKWQSEEYGILETNIAIPPCTYVGKRGRSNDKIMNVHAIAIDIDSVRPDCMKNLLSVIDSGVMPTPTYIVSSGSGCHLYYLLDEPLRIKGDMLLRVTAAKYALCIRLQRDPDLLVGYPDLQHAGQPMRAVGSWTKLGDTVRAWKTGEQITVAELLSYAEELPAECIEYYPDRIVSEGLYSDFEYQYQTEKPKEKKKSLPGLRHDPDIYHNFIARIPNEAVYGKRYFSMRAAVILALQCGIPEDQLRADLEELMPKLTAINTDEPMMPGDLEAAIAAFYQPGEWRHTYQYLSGISGIPIQKKKRAHKPRRDSKREIAAWILVNPHGSRRECSRELDIPYSTVCANWIKKTRRAPSATRQKKRK